MWDVGGQDKIRPLWRHYYQNTQGLIFVVDSSDRERIQESHDELHKMVSAEHICIIYAQKAYADFLSFHLMFSEEYKFKQSIR